MTNDDGGPLRITVYVAGEALSFSMPIDVAKKEIEKAIFWRPAPFDGSILEHLDDRQVVVGGTVSLLVAMAQKGDGTIWFTDDEGAEWGVPARSLAAVRVQDPSAKGRRRIGFRSDVPAES